MSTVEQIETILAELLEKASAYLSENGNLPPKAFFVSGGRIALSVPLQFDDADGEKISYELVTSMASVHASEAVIVVAEGYSRHVDTRAELDALEMAELKNDPEASECLTVTVKSAEWGWRWYEQRFYRNEVGDIVLGQCHHVAEAMSESQAIGDWWIEKPEISDGERCDFCDVAGLLESIPGPKVVFAVPGGGPRAIAATGYWYACGSCLPLVRQRALPPLVERAADRLVAKYPLPRQAFVLSLMQVYGMLFSFLDCEARRRAKLN